MRPIIIGVAFLISSFAKAQYFNETQTIHGSAQQKPKDELVVEFKNTSENATVKSIGKNFRAGRNVLAQVLGHRNGLYDDSIQLINLVHPEKIPVTLSRVDKNASSIMHMSHPEWSNYDVPKNLRPEEMEQDFTFIKLGLHPLKEKHHLSL